MFKYPNTNIATNVGPQFDPKDIETIEIQRGGYSAEFGERTYGVFNVVPRSGFERNREAELVASYGSFRETNDQFSVGDHSDRLAYYASVNANRTDLGLETPVPETSHDNAAGVGGFGSLIYKPTARDHFRLVASIRGDRYQVPTTPEDQAAGIDDRQRERDGFINASWLHIIGDGAFVTVSPFYHYNRAAFEGGQHDPIITTDERSSHYIGGQAVVALSHGSHNARVGVYGFYQRDDVLFGLASSDTGTALTQQTPTGHVEVIFAEDQFAVTDWLTLNGGVRVTYSSGALSENAVTPRVGIAVRVPRAEWAVRAYYGRYYQPPPLTTVSGPVLELAAEEGVGFLPLKGERDEQYEVGVAIPVQGWTVDVDYFHTHADNFFDHEPIDNSNIFIPVTIDMARIRGWEATLRAPRRQHTQAHLAYSHQFVEGRGGVSGGDTAADTDEHAHVRRDGGAQRTADLDGMVPIVALSLPIGAIDKPDVTPASTPGAAILPYLMQFGSGTWDLLPGVTLLGQTERWSCGAPGKATIRLGENDRDYRLGHRGFATGWIAARINNWVSASSRLEGTVWGNVHRATRR